MSYFTIYFRDDFEIIYRHYLIHQTKDVEVAITTLFIIFWILSDQNYDKIVDIIDINTN